MRLGVPKEKDNDETRVSIVPISIPKLNKLGFEVIIEKGAGEKSGYSDSEYEDKGGKIGDLVEVMGSELIASIDVPDFKMMKKGQMLACIADPFRNLEQTRKIIDAGITLLSLDVIPRRLSKGQSMDVNSSQDNLYFYWAALIGSLHVSKMVPMMMTAAGTITPAKVLVIGAGVAGLQAIATAKRLGAIVSATDVRTVAKEQVESLGGKFLAVEGAENLETSGGYAKEAGENFKKKQTELLKNLVKKNDIIICTALIPGKKAPRIISEEMVKSMKPGSIIYDLAVSQGGNSAFSEADKVNVLNGVKVMGAKNILNNLALSASNLYAKNLSSFVNNLYSKEKKDIYINQEDEIISKTLINKEL